MIKHMANRKKRAGVLALAVAAGISIVPLPENSAYAMEASDFKDVVSSYWGYPYIDFSSGKGIINGYQSEDGTYRFLPEKEVTKEESISMLYRVLSAAGKLESDEDFTPEFGEVFTENKIAAWAQKYVAYGLKYSLITEKELSGFTDDNGYGLPAPREQVALWTAKAMGRSLSPAYSLIYLDKDEIAAESLPYVDLLYRQGIMQGDDKKMFRPASGIKRAEFAAICNRVFDSADSEVYSEEKEIQSYRGTVVSTDSYQNRIMMTQSDGTARVIQVNPKTQIVIDGKVNYNGLAGVNAGAVSVVAWGAFYSPGAKNTDDQILQLHINTQTRKETGILTEIVNLDQEMSILKIKNKNRDVVCYILDSASRAENSPKTGTEVTFIADGIKILEMI